LEQVSADDEIVEIRDFDVDDWAAELAAFEACDAGVEHLEEPAEGLGETSRARDVSGDDHHVDRAIAVLKAAFGDDVEEVASW
jgi:hypothetical protein